MDRERVCGLIDEDLDQNDSRSRAVVPVPRPSLQSPKNSLDIKGSEVAARQNDHKQTTCYSARCLLRSDSISASKCIGVQGADYV